MPKRSGGNGETLNRFTAVILAAGGGTRMKSAHSKLSFEVCGQPMVSWVVDAAREAGASDVVVVVGHREEEVRAILADSVRYARQETLNGTGGAVQYAMPSVPEDADRIVVLYADAPLVTPATIQKAVKAQVNGGVSAVVVTATLENPFGYGRIIKDKDGYVVAIVEEKDATEEQRAICEINPGIYCFDRDALCDALGKINNQNAQNELYLTDTVKLIAQKAHVGTVSVQDNTELLGVNDRAQLAEANRLMRRRINTAHAKNGVTVLDIENTFIDKDVQIAPDAVIYPQVYLKGTTKIGAGTQITQGSLLENTVVGENVSIKSSYLYDAQVGDDTVVGPFAYVRPNSVIGKKCRIGDFVEIKNATIDNGTKVSHLTYVGDADVGSGVNFGCGTVTVNYDGQHKYRTVIGNNVFLGCNTNLVAPVTVEDGAYIAAGSTITDNVPGDSLAIARSRQVVKENWSDKRKK